MSTDEYEAAGLYDPHAPNAPDRLALLEWLAARGARLDQMVRAHREGWLESHGADLAQVTPVNRQGRQTFGPPVAGEGIQEGIGG